MALAAALQAAGVPPDRSAGLLAAAARATMSAVLLDALIDEGMTVGAHARDESGALADVISLAA